MALPKWLKYPLRVVRHVDRPRDWHVASPQCKVGNSPIRQVKGHATTLVEWSRVESKKSRLDHETRSSLTGVLRSRARTSRALSQVPYNRSAYKKQGSSLGMRVSNSYIFYYPHLLYWLERRSLPQGIPTPLLRCLVGCIPEAWHNQVRSSTPKVHLLRWHVVVGLKHYHQLEL